MIQRKANVTLGLVMSLLLAVSSLQVAVVLDAYAGQSLQKNPLTERLIPAVLGEALGSATINRQSQFKSWDRFCKYVLIFSPLPADVITRCVAALCQFNQGFAPSADQKIFASRAPPA
ncbi:MAG: hypothetical protein KKF12_06610 [Proteobacteria bacterium]|nr:hypothetical protein [Desulfobacula sp.]MBU3952526.1 hypothetical protein [Pseudomonadota bacterium]MBU4130472.1 hypothetical protein [Pseudomonadota bacterium]